jgi:hypothetical protein
MSERQTVASAHAKIDAHEDLCAERYKNINDNIKDLKDGQKWAIRLSVVTLLGLVAKAFLGGGI